MELQDGQCNSRSTALFAGLYDSHSLLRSQPAVCYIDSAINATDVINAPSQRDRRDR
jgi:hypothetical protein